MIQIPYQDRFAGKGSAAVSVVPVGAGNANGQAIARGVQVAADQLGQYGRTVVDHDRAMRQAEASKRIAGERLFWTEELPRLGEAAEPAAKGFTDGVKATYAERRDAILADYADDPALAAFVAGRLADLEAQTLGDAIGFEAKARGQQRAAAVEEVGGTLKDAVFADPRQYEAAALELRDSILAMELGPDTTAVLEEQRAGLAEAYFRGLVERDPAAARAALLAGEGPAALLKPATRHSLANAAQSAVKQADAEARAEREKGERLQAIEAGDLIYSPDKTLGEMQDEARAIADPELRAIALGQVQRRYSADRAAEADAHQRASDAAWALIDKGGTLTDLPASILAGLERSDRVAIETFTAKRAKGGEIQTDWSTYSDLMGRGRRELLATDLNRFRPILADAEFKQLVQRQQGFRDGTEPDAPDDPATLASQIGTAIQVIGLEKGDKSGRFEAAARAEVDRQQQALGRKLTYAERQAVVDRLSLTVTTTQRAWWYDTQVKLYEVKDGEAYQFTDDDLVEQGDVLARLLEVPRERLLPTAAALEAAGLPVVETTLQMAAALIDSGQPVTRETMEALAAKAKGGRK
jgi:hypothetical protein